MDKGDKDAPRGEDNEATSITCEACGAVNTEEDEVCGSCGEALWEDAAEDGTGAPPEGWKPLLIGVIVAVVVVGIVVAKPWSRLAKRGPKGEATATSVATSPEVNQIHELKQDGSLIWVGTSGGVFAHDRKTLDLKLQKTDGLLHPFIDSLTIDSAGKKWFGCFRGGFDVFDGTNWSELPATVTHDATAIESLVDSSGTMWFGTDGKGLLAFDGKEWRQYTHAEYGLPDDSAHSSDKVHAIAEDHDGSIWIGTEDGVARFSKNKEWKAYRVKDGLAANHVETIVIDQKGDKWLGTWGKGISRFDGSHWTTYGYTPDPAMGPGSDFVTAAKMDAQGRLWFGTQDGVSLWDGKAFARFRESDGLLGKDVWAVEVDSDGYKWFGTYKGVSRLDPGNKEWKTIVH